MQSILGKQFPVLDKGYVELQDLMGNDLAIVNAARVSFLGESKGETADKKLLRYLMQHRHTSPFEQVIFKFRVKLPVVVAWQWARHRTWSFNLQSGRYTPFDEDDFYIPTEWRLQAANNKQGSDGVADEDIQKDLSIDYNEILNKAYLYYRNALASGIAKEQARLFLPAWASYYTMVATVDAHNLMHFLTLRMASDAQWEIRQYAGVIYEQIFKPALPWTAEAFEEFRFA